MHNISTEIAGVKLNWDVKSPFIYSRLKKHYKDYPSRKNGDGIKIKVRCDCAKKPGKYKVLYRGENWEFGEAKGAAGYILRFRKNVAWAFIDKCFSKVDFYTKDSAGQLLLYLFPEILFSAILPKYNAVMVHGCGIIAGNRKYLFVASSGGGKSTIAKLALDNGFNVLNDDRIIIVRKNKQFIAYGNPWHGEIKNTLNIGFPIKKIILLQKADTEHISYIKNKEVLEIILQNIFYLPGILEAKKKVIGFAFNMLDKIDFYRLDFTLKNDVFKFLRKNMA